MQHLLLDNFRGFKRTIIAFSSVNFLVGENSTGKTSVLGLINLLRDQNFWFSHDFNIGGHEFGRFKDLVSAGSAPGANFTIGFALEKANPSAKAPTNLCQLVTYHEDKARPVPTFFGRLNGQTLVCAKLCGHSYRYQAETLPPDRVPHSAAEMFALLERRREADRTDYTPLTKSFPARIGLLPMLSVIEGQLSHRPKSEGFFIPLSAMSMNLAWFAPIRTNPKRTYDAYMSKFSPEGEHTPYLLRKMLSGKKSEKRKFGAFVKSLRDFGHESGLFEDVMIKEFNKTGDSPFELLIKLSHAGSLRINSVGYGVSQALPLIIEMLARSEGSWYAIQQPEVHLHPRAQAALGDLVFHLAEEENKHFLIETHSDFTIDRFRKNFAVQKRYHTTGQVLFFERAQKGNKVTSIKLLANGEFSPDQPESYRRFFLKEQMTLLGL